MRIALDYDQTYTVDPEFWEGVIALAGTHSHTVTCVTKRGVSNQGETCEISCPVVYTDRAAKLPYTEEMGLHFDIWIDDAPQNLFIAG